LKTYALLITSLYHLSGFLAPSASKVTKRTKDDIIVVIV